MEILKKNIGRRQFISLGSMALGAGMLAKPAGRLVKAIGAPVPAAAAETDGTKYGKYIVYAENAEPTERGIQMFGMGGSTPGFSTIIIGRMPPPGPMPSHDAPEQHLGEIEYLIHLGNNQDDPLDLGADVNFYLGNGKWLEHHPLNKSTAVYLPPGQWHCPWRVERIRRVMTWVNVRISLPYGSSSTESTMMGGAPGGAAGGPPGGAPGSARGGAPQMESEEGLSAEERAKAKTSDFAFEELLLSGAPKGMKDPQGGKWIAYTDCTKMPGAAMTRIIRYNPQDAPYSIIDTKIYEEYPSLYIFLGTDEEDCTDLGADVEMILGPEKEKHTFNKSCYVYVPKNLVHGPFKVTKADKPFNFLEIVAGPELPAAV